MEKARFEIIRTKKGNLVANLIFEDNKKIPLTDYHPRDMAFNGKEVLVEREKGQVMRIISEGKEIYSRKKQHQNKQHQNIQKHSKSSTDEIYSKAPYNFVPLNDRVVFAEPIPDFDRYHTSRYTGYIEIEIKALTPLYIRDTLTEDEYREKIELESKSRGEQKLQYINPDFFGPGGIIRIPGSSLRGMIRNMVEIISFGKFVFYENRRLYYRSFADRCKNFREEYANYTKNIKAGVMIKEGLQYFIIPSNYTKINKADTRKLIGKNPEDFQYYPVKHKHKDGYIVVSGYMEGKKIDWFIEKPDKHDNRILLSREDIQDYKNDRERKAKLNLLEKLNKQKEVPCFYTEYTDNQGKPRIAFGHTKNFRLPCVKSIADHIPDKLKAQGMDIAEAVFGNEKSHASRVFFEDAYLKEGQTDVLMQTFTPKILSSPKPTTFQHYLKQFELNLKDFPRNLAHYNSTNPIRGYKLYWHRDANDWIETNEENIKKHERQYTKITPVKDNTVFKSIIRFENLTDVELGALLFAIDLPEGCAHKLGMAKPLGLGSVTIKPTLYLSNRIKRYQELFSEWNKLTPADRAKIDELKLKFEQYIIRSLGETGLKSLWDSERMKKLKRMLDYRNKPSNEKTQYLELKEFRSRKVLPEPTQI